MFLLHLPWLRQFVAGLNPGEPTFEPKFAHVGFVVEAVALKQVILPVLLFSLSASTHQCSISIHSSPNLYDFTQ